MSKPGATFTPMRVGLLFGSLLLAVAAWPCELLVRITEKPMHADANEHRRGRSIAGNIIVVRPDGWSWGNKEGWPDYAVVKIPGVSVAECQKYEQPQYDASTNLFRYREWQINFTNLPTVFRSVVTNSTLSITATGPRRWSYFRTNLLNLRTWTTETNNLTFP